MWASSASRCGRTHSRRTSVSPLSHAAPRRRDADTIDDGAVFRVRSWRAPSHFGDHERHERGGQNRNTAGMIGSRHVFLKPGMLANVELLARVIKPTAATRE